MWSQTSKKQAQFADQDVDLSRASEADALETDSAAEGSNHGRGSGGSTTNEGTSTNRDDVACELTKLAGNDNRNVRIWKFMVVTIIAIAGALVSTGIYYYLRFQEDEEIKDNFILFANTIEDVSRIQYKSMLDASRGLSSIVTTEAIQLNQTFPFVTINNFEVFARQARIASKAELMSLSLHVEADQLQAFNAYAPSHAQEWLAASQMLNNDYEGTDAEIEIIPTLPFVYDTEIDIVTGEQSIAPTTTRAEVAWQISPVIKNGFLLLSNLIGIASANPDDNAVVSSFEVVRITQEPTFAMPTLEASLWVDAFIGEEEHFELHEQVHAKAFAADANDLPERADEHPDTEHTHGEVHVLDDDGVTTYQPHGMILTPVFDSFDKETQKNVGTINSIFSLDIFMVKLLPNGVNGFYLVVESECGDDNLTYTYRVDGNHAFYLGVGDLSESVSSDLKHSFTLEDFFANPELHRTTDGACLYTYKVSSSKVFEDSMQSEVPMVFACVVGAIFFIMAITFFVYDSFVSRRNAKVWGAAVRSTAIVSSLFPSQVRDQIYADPADAAVGSSSAKLRRFMDKAGTVGGDDVEDNDDVVLDSKPIAELYPNTTVMFCDIAGFTAWSSVREPSQVFTLLETVYRAFDRIAKQRHVFKVETVGDCYVAVAGCPDPMKNHAVVMSRFASECLTTMDTLTKRLEVILGPDTGDLAVRIGLHSGPVTAGVLRGERARFQLFGDTMNTAARVESTGEKGRIQVSEETAELLLAAGKNHWLVQRADIVYAKGKGALKTYWLVDEKGSSDTRSNNEFNNTGDIKHSSGDNAESRMPRTELADRQALDSKTERLINWNVDVMWRLLKKVVARRISHNQENSRVSRTEEEDLENTGGSVLSEVKEIIALPKFDPVAHKKEPDSETVNLEDTVKAELYTFVASIASMYRFNPFHSFEHASHVTMSVVKLLSRIVAPIDEVEGENVASSMHDHTYGITSDPLTQFACVLSALIHDADHPGVPNTQLVKEANHLAKFYNNQSIAEQNSVDLAWNLLMDEEFTNLRGAIYGTAEEMRRFRQLVVNSVMATDIVDKELKSLRNARWEKAFSETAYGKDAGELDAINRKATIVIEHLIQASDVAHTMQHWHIYRKWNERFFMECYAAYKAGRADLNPAANWYKGELGFFDFYIIPLAKKLKECGVFGVASDEYLNYAQKNRQEWEIRGAEIVAGMVEKVTTNEETTEHEASF